MGPLLALVAVASCGSLQPLARSSGAMLSNEGVLFAVVGQSCKQAPDPNRPGKSLLDVTFAIEVGNPTLDSLTVHRDRFLLMVSERTSVRTSSPDAVEPLAVESGTTGRFTLRYVAPGVSCTHELQLDPSSVLELRGREINVNAIRFVPVAPG